MDFTSWMLLHSMSILAIYLILRSLDHPLRWMAIVPATMEILLVLFMLVDGRCEGSFKVRWYRCSPEFLNPVADRLGEILFLNFLLFIPVMGTLIVALAGLNAYRLWKKTYR